MQVKLITIGITSDSYLESALKDYEKRLSKYCNYERIELSNPKNGSKLNRDELLKKEAELLEKRLQSTDFVVLLDENGVSMKSVEFAGFLQQKMNSGIKQLVFVIGGPFGFSNELKKKAGLQLSLSKMTLTHQMVRLFFTEQLYRAHTILKGEKYHHE